MSSSKPSLALVLGVALSCGLAACAPPRSAFAYIEDAKALHLRHEDKAAVIQLKNALTALPNNVEARLLLAAIYADIQEHRGAEVEFRRVLELRPDSAPAAAGIVRALIRQNDFQRALDELDAMSRRRNGLTAQLLALQGDARIGLGEASAKASYTAALEAVPGLAEAQLGLARLEAGDGHPDDALRRVAEVLDRAPGDVEALLVKGDVLQAMSKNAEAERTYRQAQASRRDDTRARLRLAALYIRTDRFDEARREIDAVKAAEPQNLLALYHLAALYMKEKKYPLARDTIQLVRARAPKHLPSLQLSGAAAFHNDAIEQAEHDLSTYLLRRPEDNYARKLLAANSLRADNPDKALATVAPLLASGTDAQAFAIAGEAALRTNQLAKADAYLQKAASLAPENAGVRALLGMSHLARGDDRAGFADLETASELADDPSRARRVLVQAHLDRREFGQALAVVAGLEKSRPKEAWVFHLKAEVLLAQGDVAQARTSLETAVGLQPGHLPSINALAALDVRDQNFESARVRFRTLLDRDPKSAQAMLGLAKVAAAAHADADELGWLEKAVAAAPADLQARLLLVQYHLERKALRKALASAYEAYAANPNEADALALLAGTQFAAGEKEAAVTTYHTLVKAVPGSAPANFRLAMVYLDLRQYAAARDTLERTLELRPDYPEAQSALAMLEVQAGRHRAALRIAQGMRERNPRSPEGAALEGDVRMSQHDYAGAAAAYDAALAVAKTSAFFLKAHVALLRAGRTREADEKAQSWLRTLPGDNAARLYLAAIAMESGKNPQAVRHYEAVLEREPGNFVALNNLAWLYQQAKDPRAFAVAQEAHRVRPDDPRIVDTLGWILVQRGDTARGVEMLQRAVALDPVSAGPRYRLAEGYVRLGDKARARTTLDALLATDESFAERPDAAALRQQL